MNSKTLDDSPDLPHPSLALGYSDKKKSKSTIERIQNAMYIIANLVVEGDQKLLPLFQRLESELEKQKNKARSLERAEKMSRMRPKS